MIFLHRFSIEDRLQVPREEDGHTRQAPEIMINMKPVRIS